MMLNMNSAACHVSISRTVLGTVLFALLLVFPAQARQWDPQGAALAFQEARQKRDEIFRASQPPLSLYLDCARIYRKVHIKDPHYAHTGDAIYEEGLIYQEMGDKFSNLEFYRTAAKRFNLLVKDYGGNQNCPDALMRLTDIYQRRLKDEAAAQNVYQLLRTQYKNSGAARRVAESPPDIKPQSDPPKVDTLPIPDTAATSLVQNIRHWSTGEYTRVIIDMDSAAKYLKERLSSPERIYFDISNARLGSDFQSHDIQVDDQFLKQIRIAAKGSDMIRVVLDLAETSDCSISELRDPFRIVVDLFKPGTSVQASKAFAPGAKADANEEIARTSSKDSFVLEAKSAKGKIITPVQRENSAAGLPDRVPGTKPKEPPLAVTEFHAPPAKVTKSTVFALPTGAARQPTESSAQSMSPKTVPPDPILEAKVRLPPLSVTGNQSAAVGTKSVPKNSPTENAETKAEVKADVRVDPSASTNSKALPSTSRGDRTLTRMLGLKIGRIVIDPGHGGHDLGSIGPGGLFEKDLVLSIATDLKKVLQEKLGAEVFLTRSDDTFITLEERTTIANQHRADLFISIHANSSRRSTTSGVETYYLDFAKTDAEREIAGRENAATASTIHELENLIKKIAQADKSAESRELAVLIQKSLYSGAKKLIPSTQNRGVRSAPFVVLIGANMPSVLAEVAFISNPRDERLLKRPTNQERLVNALFSGIEGYMKTLGSEFVQNQIRIK